MSGFFICPDILDVFTNIHSYGFPFSVSFNIPHDCRTDVSRETSESLLVQSIVIAPIFLSRTRFAFGFLRRRDRISPYDIALLPDSRRLKALQEKNRSTSFLFI